jgi:hypothetical protein
MFFSEFILSLNYSQGIHPYLQIHSAHYAPKFFQASNNRVQLLCTILLPSDILLDVLHESLAQAASSSFTSQPLVPNSKRSLITSMLNLPLELQLRIIEQDVLSSFSACECHKLQCKGSPHTKRCTKGITSEKFRLPRLFILSAFRHVYSNKISSSRIGINCIYTFEDNNLEGLPPYKLRSFEDPTQRQFLILCPSHGQFQMPLDPEQFRVNIPAPHSEVDFYSPLRSRRDLLELRPCPTSVGHLVPQHPQFRDHTLVYD